MRSSWKILHLTDFHIADPSSDSEHLRTGHYRDYVDGLAKSLTSSSWVTEGELDAIVLTGDFVDRGQLKNFPHVSEVIKYLCQQLKFDHERVFVCNGNHDIDRVLDKTNNVSGARHEFIQFAKNYGNKHAQHQTDRFTLTKSANDAFFLMIDSTIGSNGEDCPGSISISEVDQIITTVRDKRLGEQDILIVASHHPPNATFQITGPFDESDPSWHNKHIWSAGHPLLVRLQDAVAGPVLWLSGDIHTSKFVKDNKIHCAVTGRFGCSVNGRASQVRRQARVITIPHTGVSTSWIFEYVPNGHIDHSQVGEWEPKENPPEIHSRGHKGFIQAPNYLVDTVSQPPVANAQRVSRNEIISSIPNQSVHLLSPELQSEIFQVIERENLYSLGRFITSKTESTLAWIPMGALMDEGELLVSTIHEMTKWIATILAQEAPDDPVIIGIDSWGAILASQLSVTRNVRNYCIAGRVQGNTHSTAERISDTVVSAVAKSDMIVLISDVIGTGRSVRHIYQVLSERMSAKQKERAKWVVLSVICDEQHNRGDALTFAYANGTACKDLRIPILSNDLLPSLEILPPDISFLR